MNVVPGDSRTTRSGKIYGETVLVLNPSTPSKVDFDISAHSEISDAELSLLVDPSLTDSHVETNPLDLSVKECAMGKPKIKENAKEVREPQVIEEVKKLEDAGSKPVTGDKSDGSAEPGQYTEMANELCKILKPQLETEIMPKLNDIQNALNDPNTGLVNRTKHLETTINTKKTGLVARMDRMENVLNNGDESVSKKVKNFSPLVDKILPMDTRLTALEIFAALPNAALDTKISNVEADVQAATTKVNELETSVTNLQGTRLATPVEGSVTNVDLEQIRANKRKCVELSEKLELASNYIDSMHKDMSSMKKQLLAHSAKNMSNDLIVGGIREEDEAEDCKDVTRQFFMNKMNLNVLQEDIVEAYRSSFSNTKNIRSKMVRIPPVMFVKVTEKLRKQVLANSWRLNNLKDETDGYGYYVKQSMPEEYRAVRAKYKEDYDTTKDEYWNQKEGDNKPDCWYAGANYVKDKKIIEEPVKLPTPREMLFMSLELKKKLMEIEVRYSTSRSESYSHFIGAAVLVEAQNEVKLAYMRIKRDQQRADHIMLAYRLKLSDTEIQQGSVSNGEHFGDLEVMRVLEEQHKVNVAVFVARQYGGIPLGKNRFKHIKDVTEEALAKVDPPVLVIAKSPKPARTDTTRGRGRDNQFRGRGRGFNARSNSAFSRGRAYDGFR